jgi:UDP-N-acetylglucosamine 3-dehydrogenase
VEPTVSQRLRVGLVSWAHVHAPGLAATLAELPQVEFAGTYDEDERRGSGAARALGIPWFSSLETLLDGCEAVVISSTNADHRRYTEAAARVGVHVLSEKPLATTLEDARAMVGACRDAGVQLGTAFPVRSSAAVIALREAIQSGSLGRVRAARCANPGQYPGLWFGDPRAAGGGAVMDHVVHVADALRWLLDDEPVRVYAETNALMHGLAVEDCGVLTVDFSGGAFASIDCSWSRPRTYPTWGGVTFHVVGDRATVDVDVFRQTIAHYDDSGGRLAVVGWGDDLTRLMVAGFVDAILDGRPVPITGDDGLRALEVALAAYWSVSYGRAVPVGE